MSGLSGFSARFERFERFERFGRFGLFFWNQKLFPKLTVFIYRALWNCTKLYDKHFFIYENCRTSLFGQPGGGDFLDIIAGLLSISVSLLAKKTSGELGLKLKLS